MHPPPFCCYPGYLQLYLIPFFIVFIVAKLKFFTSLIFVLPVQSLNALEV